jgi:hypothetical protein
VQNLLVSLSEHPHFVQNLLVSLSEHPHFVQNLLVLIADNPQLGKIFMWLKLLVIDVE